MENTLQKCGRCSKDFLIIEQEQRFLQKKKLPSPTSCPDCRQKRRLSLRNERKLYKRPCDQCKTPMISTYSEESTYVVYCQDCFWRHIG